MFRQLLLPCANPTGALRLPGAFGLAAAFGLALSALPAPAWSQDRSPPERLDRIERDLNMLQRQVYRGAPPSAMGGGDAGGAVQSEIRMDRLETQMRDLTGRVEEFLNEIAQIRQRVEQVHGDVETRFSQAPAGAGPLTAANPAQSRPGPAGAARPARQYAAETPGGSDAELPPPRIGPRAGAGPGSLMPPGTVVPPPGGPMSGAPGPGAPAPIFGTLTPPGAPAAPGELASAAPAGQPPAAGLLPKGSAADQYNYAFGLLKQADYPAAETALKAFVEQNPRDPMAGNAQFWLGETYYTRNKYLEAASAFAEGYKRYPKSAKAADNLLKLGMSLGRANQKQNACLAFAQLDHDFPQPGAAVKERAAAEKKRLGRRGAGRLRDVQAPRWNTTLRPSRRRFAPPQDDVSLEKKYAPWGAEPAR